MTVLFRFLLVVLGAVVGLTFLPSVSQAQQPVVIKFNCNVRGEWVRIDEGSNSGGEIIRRGDDVVTDRVSRGEQLRISVDDASFTRKCRCVFTLRARVGNKTRKLFDGNLSIPSSKTFVVPNDASFDNIYVEIYDPIAPGGKVERRIPIGTRPAHK